MKTAPIAGLVGVACVGCLFVQPLEEVKERPRRTAAGGPITTTSDAGGVVGLGSRDGGRLGRVELDGAVQTSDEPEPAAESEPSPEGDRAWEPSEVDHVDAATGSNPGLVDSLDSGARAQDSSEPDAPEPAMTASEPQPEAGVAVEPEPSASTELDSGSGGAAAVEEPAGWYFRTDDDGWVRYGGLPGGITDRAELTWDGDVGDGSLVVAINFNAADERLEISPGSLPSDLQSRTAYALLRLSAGAGGDTGDGVGAMVWVKSGPSAAYADSGITPITSEWTLITLVVDTPVYVQENYTPTTLTDFGVSIIKLDNGNFTPVEVQIDSVWYE